MSKHIQFDLWSCRNCLAFLFLLQCKIWKGMADAWSVFGRKTNATRRDDLVHLGPWGSFLRHRQLALD